MNSSLSESSEGLTRLEESLKECMSVIYRRPCRRVLKKIIELWENGREATVYVLEEKELRDIGHADIEKAVKLLSECGLIYVKTGIRAKTGSPRGKNLLYPTPLGLVMNTILGLLYPEERGIGGSEVIYPLADYYVENTLFQRLPVIYEYMVLVNKERKLGIRREKLVKGFLTTLHAVNMLFLKAVEVEEKTGLPMRPSYSSKDLLELIKENISEDISFLERSKPEVKEGSIHYKLLEYLQKEYNRLARALGVHGQGENSTRINTQVS